MALPIVADADVSRCAHAEVALPTVAALDALWTRFSQQPMWLPQRLWRRLQLLREMREVRPRTLHPDAVPIVAPVGKINDCMGCTDLCCVGPQNTVLLRLRDLATLQDVGQTELIARDKPSFSPELLARRPALRRQVASAAWRRFPVLKQNAYGACMALRDDGKCGLYPHWPLSCARFPYSLDAQTAEAFYARRCQSYFIHPKNAPAAKRMAVHAVAGYNERIKDALLLRFCADSLADLGLLRYLNR